MIQSTDQLNRKISLHNFPVRIISVVPSLTELLFDLNLNDEVIGITKFCVHPKVWFRSKERVGGTKKLNIEKIRLLKPDLIIANKEENDEKQIGILENEFPVWISDIKNLKQALEMISELSLLVNRKEEGEVLIRKINSEFKNLSPEPGKIISCAYLIWNNPMMVAGGDTFISDMLKHARYKNVFENQFRYPIIEMETIQRLKPDIIFLSSEPFPFKENHRTGFQMKLPDTTVILVDGEMFSWYGSRLLKAVSYFKQLREKLNSAL